MQRLDITSSPFDGGPDIFKNPLDWAVSKSKGINCSITYVSYALGSTYNFSAFFIDFSTLGLLYLDFIVIVPALTFSQRITNFISEPPLKQKAEKSVFTNPTSLSV